MSLLSVDSSFSDTVQDQLDVTETARLEKLEEMPVSDSSIIKRSHSMKFLMSPLFLSRRRPKNYSNSNLIDNGTPKAVIRDRYRKVSIALTNREVELEKERQARLELEKEHQELQEFTRLEDETGVCEERRMLSRGLDADMPEKLKFYEKSFFISKRKKKNEKEKKMKKIQI